MQINIGTNPTLWWHQKLIVSVLRRNEALTGWLHEPLYIDPFEVRWESAEIALYLAFDTVVYFRREDQGEDVFESRGDVFTAYRPNGSVRRVTLGKIVTPDPFCEAFRRATPEQEQAAQWN